MSEFKFETEASDVGELHVAEIRGTESLSTLFEYEIKLVAPRRSGAVIKDMHTLLYNPAVVEFARRLDLAGGGVGKVRERRSGVLSAFSMLDADQDWIVYQAVLRPLLWKLTLTHRSRVFCLGEQPQTIAEILSGVLTEHGLAKGTDFEFKDFQDEKLHPKRSYVVQYEESDYDFLARWLEHEGIYYYFENVDGREKVVFADSVGGYRRLSGKKAFRYSPPGPDSAKESAGALNVEEVVQSFTTTLNPIPRRLILNDYNWRTPDSLLTVPMAVGPRDDLAYAGTHSEYNYHYKDAKEGEALGRVLAEEFRCREQLFQGQSSARAFRPGHVFELVEYFHGDFNREFLLTQVRVSGSQTISLDGSGAAGSAGVFTNDFTAIPDDVVFRPPAETEWPTIHGVIHGVIDGELDDQPYSQVDADGMYRLRLPFDNTIMDEELTTPGAGLASRPTRMAQPYVDSASGAGFHFPLHKGTDVVVYHVDGDPDRPMIAGAVTNPLHESPVAADPDVAGQLSRITTTSGNTTVFDDSTESPGVLNYNSDHSNVTDDRNHTTGGGGGGPTGYQLFTGKSGGGGGGGGGGGAVGRGVARREAQPGPGLGMADAELDHRHHSSIGTSNNSTMENTYEGWVDKLVKERNVAVGKLDAPIGPATVSGSDVVGYPFTGSKSDAGDFRIWDRSTYTLLNGDAACTFNNVSCSVNFDTGGYSYKHSDGDEENHSTKKGDTVNHSFDHGNSVSTSMKFGATTSTSMELAANNSNSLFVGLVSSNSISIALKQSVGIDIAGSVAFSLDVGGKYSIAITVAGERNLEIAAGKIVTITVGEIDKIEVDRKKAGLNKKQAVLCWNKTVLKHEEKSLKKAHQLITDEWMTITTSAKSLDNELKCMKLVKDALTEEGKGVDNKLTCVNHEVTSVNSKITAVKWELMAATTKVGGAVVQLGA